MYNHNPFREQTLGQILDAHTICPVYNTFEVNLANWLRWYNSQYLLFYGEFLLHWNVERWTHDTEHSLEVIVNF